MPPNITPEFLVGLINAVGGEMKLLNANLVALRQQLVSLEKKIDEFEPDGDTAPPNPLEALKNIADQLGLSFEPKKR